MQTPRIRHNRYDKRLARRDCPAMTLCALLRADLALARAREVVRTAMQYAGTRSSPIPTR